MAGPRGVGSVHSCRAQCVKKPEEFQIITPAAFETHSGITDHNTNGNIMKQNSNHTTQSMK